MPAKPQRLASLALAFGWLVVTSGHGLAQGVVGGGVRGGGIGQIIVVEANVQAGNPRGPVPIGEAPGAEAAGIEVDDGHAIGDPWWDDAEVKAGEAARPAGRGDDEPDGLHRKLQPDPNLAIQHRVAVQALLLLRRELSVVRQTCPSLERQQRSLVLQAGRGAIEKAVAEMQEMPNAGRRGNAVDVAAAVVAALRATVAANATPEESAAYEAEQSLRKERARQAVAAELVAEVDRHAYLDEAEREALRKAFAESYRERWRPALDALQQGTIREIAQALPGVERCVEQAIGPERKAEWLTRREEARKLAAVDGPPQLQVQAFGNGNQQQVIVNGQQIFVGGAGGRVQFRIEARAGALQAKEPLKEAPEAAAEEPAREGKK